MWSSPPCLAIALTSLLASCAYGCGEDPAADPAMSDHVLQRVSMPAAEQVAALVDGVPITVDNVQELLDEADGGLGPTEALDALVRQQLLAAEAERRGYGGDVDVMIERSKAMAAALIDQQAESITLESIDQRRLRGVYQQRLNTFVHGPKRRAIHVVARTGKKRLTDEQARELIVRVGDAVRGATTKKQFRAAAKPLVVEQGRRKLKIETLPPFHEATKRIAAPFVAAAFGLPGPGHQSEPFQTRFGWHVLLVFEELPARNLPYEEAREIIGAEVVPLERRKVIDGLVEELGEQAGVFVYEASMSSGAAEQ
ncbi:MAG: peptidyl-prolyl cis-trans isomerase [Deltaproteobacteria bacterium]|nr:peptidyl-prolyl cis-trans isomerase [Deltaproteobacteria bacterium]